MARFQVWNNGSNWQWDFYRGDENDTNVVATCAGFVSSINCATDAGVFKNEVAGATVQVTPLGGE